MKADVAKQIYITGLLAGLITGIAIPAVITGAKHLINENYDTGLPVFFVGLVIAIASLVMGRLKLKGLCPQKLKVKS